MPKHLGRHAQHEEGLWNGGGDKVTMRLLLYSLLRVLFTPETLHWGARVRNVQSRRLLINAVSGSWQQKHIMTQCPILFRKDYA